MDAKERVLLERNLLGLILNFPENFGDLFLIGLEGQHFSAPLHRQVFDIFLREYKENQAVPSLALLLGEFPPEQRKRVEREIFSAKEETSDSWENFRVYSTKLIENYLNDELLSLTGGIADKVKSGQSSDEIKEALIQGVMNLGTSSSVLREPIPLDRGIESLLEQWKEAGKTGTDESSQMVIPTGYVELDELLGGGFRTGTVSLVAARPGHGKSTFLQNLCLHSALYYGIPSVFFSLEMPKDQLVKRLLSALTMKIDGNVVVPLNAMRKVKEISQNAQYLKRTEEVIKTINGIPLYVVDASGISASEIYALAKIFRDRLGAPIFFVDYFQLLKRDGGRMPRDESDFAELSEAMRLTARNHNVAVVMASQLNRNVEARSKEDQRPKLSDLRNTGKLEQDAEIIIGLFNDEKVYGVESTRPREIDVEILKNRDGSDGIFPLYFAKECMCFNDLALGSGD